MTPHFVVAPKGSVALENEDVNLRVFPPLARQTRALHFTFEAITCI